MVTESGLFSIVPVACGKCCWLVWILLPCLCGTALFGGGEVFETPLCMLCLKKMTVAKILIMSGAEFSLRCYLLVVSNFRQPVFHLFFARSKSYILSTVFSHIPTLSAVSKSICGTLNLTSLVSLASLAVYCFEQNTFLETEYFLSWGNYTNLVRGVSKTVTCVIFLYSDYVFGYRCSS